MINAESLGLYDIPPPNFSHEFAQLLNNPELSDFVIVPSNGQELHVHQVILITRWPHFRNIYRSGMIEAQQRRMEIPEPYEIVLAFLKYLYSDRLDENEPWHVVCEVLVVANMYLLNRLKKICCERLFRRHMTVESCGLIFEKAIMAEETGLKMLALDFMFRNYGSVLKSDVLLQMPLAVRQEFMEAVPDEATLEVSRSASSIVPRTLPSPTKCLTASSSSTSHNTIISNTSTSTTSNNTTITNTTTPSSMLGISTPPHYSSPTSSTSTSSSYHQQHLHHEQHHHNTTSTASAAASTTAAAAAAAAAARMRHSMSSGVQTNSMSVGV